MLDSTKLEACADDKINVAQNDDFCLKSWKTFWKKEKMLISIFSFFHNVFKMPLPQDH